MYNIRCKFKDDLSPFIEDTLIAYVILKIGNVLIYIVSYL